MNKMKTIITAAVLSLLLLSLSAHGSITNSIGKLWKAGYVGARNLVTGPNGKPIYAEIDEFGNVLQQYGEAVGTLANAQVISGDQYRSYFSRLEQLKKANPGFTIQRINNKSQLLSANGDLLLEAPVDFNAEDIATTQNTSQNPLPASLPISSVLISEQGIVVHRTTNRIAFRVAMFGAGDGSDLGSANDSNIYRGNSNNRLLGPMIGSRIQYGSRAINTAFTGLDGYYYIDVKFPPCPNFNMTLDTTMKMDLQYTNFNPRAAKPFNTWYFTSPTSDTCLGLDQVVQGIVRTAIQSIQNSTVSVDYYNNFIVDLIMISGQNNRLVKLDGSNIPLADTTEYALNPIDYAPLAQSPNLDLDGDGVTDKQALRSDGQIAVYLNGRTVQTDAAGQPINEDLLRQADTQAQRNGQTLKPEQQHQGLLKQISEEDLLDTDILTYREANGALVTERNKLQIDRVVGIGKGSSFGAGLNANGSLYYNNPVVWTEYKIDNAFEVSAFSNQPAANQQVNNSPTQSRFIRDIIRPGEFIKTVIINRASGYIGTQSAQIKSNATTAGNTLGTLVSPIELRPPNLKIKVERHHKAKTRVGNKLKDIDNIVGFEGSGLTTDTMLVITTEWYDQDGSPLPDDLPGYTARLAKVVRDKVPPPLVIDRLDDATVGTFVAQFEISPGTHTKSIYIPEDNRAEHFYIHISGQPIDRQSDFSVKGIQGILGERPAKYVPFKVAIYDEATTNQLKLNARKSGADPKDIKPVYNWVYRPEMQFSLFDLDNPQLQLTDKQGKSQLIDLTQNTGADLTGLLSNNNLDYAELLYDLTGPQFDELARLSGDRELIFTIGGEEALATITPGGTVKFTNPQNLSLLDNIDLLSIKLYQANDAANILWQYDFAGIYAYYKIPHVTRWLKKTKASPQDNKEFRILGGIRIRLEYAPEPDEKNIINYEWSLSPAGKFKKDFKFAAPVVTDTNKDTIYWEPNDWKENHNIIGKLKITYDGGKTKTKDFKITSRILEPKPAGQELEGSDVAMLEELLWQLGLSPQDGFPGQQANRIDSVLPDPTNPNVQLAKDRNIYSDGAAYIIPAVFCSNTNPCPTSSLMQKKNVSIEKMVRRLKGRHIPVGTGRANNLISAGHGAGTDGVLRQADLDNLKILYEDYIEAFQTNPNRGIISIQIVNGALQTTNIKSAWITNALNVWSQAGYDNVTHQGMLAVGETATRRDLLLAWLLKEGGDHWGKGAPQTNFRITEGGAEDWGSMGFNQIIFQYSYGNNATCNMDQLNMYDPGENILGLTKWLSDPTPLTGPRCDNGVYEYFSGQGQLQFVQSFDNINPVSTTNSGSITLPRIRGFFKIPSSFISIPKNATHTDDEYEQLSKAIMGYNAGRGSLDDGSWLKMLLSFTPTVVAKRNNSSGRPDKAMQYSIDIRKTAGMLRRIYTLEWTVTSSQAAQYTGFAVNSTFCFNYSEDHWYSNISWAAKRDEVFSGVTPAVNCATGQ